MLVYANVYRIHKIYKLTVPLRYWSLVSLLITKCESNSHLSGKTEVYTPKDCWIHSISHDTYRRIYNPSRPHFKAMFSLIVWENVNLRSSGLLRFTIGMFQNDVYNKDGTQDLDHVRLLEWNHLLILESHMVCISNFDIFWCNNEVYS